MSPFVQYKNILEKYIDKQFIPLLENAWNEPHRYYHNVNHLKNVINLINSKRFDLDSLSYDILILSSFFHDCYYNPRENKNNEDESIKRFLSCYCNKNINIKDFVIKIIESTKYRKIPENYVIRTFWDADNHIFCESYNNLLQWEKDIRNEYKHVFDSVYKKERIKFLKSNLNLFSKEVDDNINKLISYVQKQ